MKIHLISIEVGIVRRTDTFIETKGAVGQHLSLVAHDGKFMQRRLTVEENNIAIYQMTLNEITML